MAYEASSAGRQYRSKTIAEIETRKQQGHATARCSNEECQAVIHRPVSRMPKHPYCSVRCIREVQQRK